MPSVDGTVLSTNRKANSFELSVADASTIYVLNSSGQQLPMPGERVTVDGAWSKSTTPAGNEIRIFIAHAIAPLDES